MSGGTGLGNKYEMPITLLHVRRRLFEHTYTTYLHIYTHSHIQVHTYTTHRVHYICMQARAACIQARIMGRDGAKPQYRQEKFQVIPGLIMTAYGERKERAARHQPIDCNAAEVV
jgi:hypothetical protein